MRRLLRDVQALFRAEEFFSGLRPQTDGRVENTHAPIPSDRARSFLETQDRPTPIDELSKASHDLGTLRGKKIEFVVPMIAATDLVGTLNVGPRADGVPYSSGNLNLLARFGRTAARGIRIAQLRRAIDDDELVLHYQPKLDLATRQVTGVEALVRWEQPERGLIPPGRFVPLCEDGPLSSDFTRWVLRQAVKQLGMWQQAGIGPLTMAVNVPPGLFVTTGLVDDITEALDTYDVAPEKLQIELTETAFAEDQEMVLAVAQQISDHGVGLAIDDFGTGYSALAYLQRLPVDDVKIDRQFVTDMVSSASDQVIVRSTITLSHDLGFHVVAEGVEDDATAQMLAKLGCDSGQGYLWTRPLPPEEFVTWLAEWNRARRG